MQKEHIELLNQIKEQDKVFGFYGNLDVKSSALMSQLISDGYIKGLRQSHDDGVIFSKVQITMKGMAACENFGKKRSEWTLQNRLTVLSIMISLLAIIPAIVALYIVKS